MTMVLINNSHARQITKARKKEQTQSTDDLRELVIGLIEENETLRAENAAQAQEITDLQELYLNGIGEA